MSQPDPLLSLELCADREDHARQVMTWRNDPEALAASFDQREKRWDVFRQEYRDAYLTGRPTPVFVLQDDRRIGFLRFRQAAHPEGLAGQAVDVSINIAPDSRSAGLGQAVLAAAEPYLRAAGVDSLLAEVRPENERSAKLFLKAGYRETTPGVHPDGAGSPVQVRRFLRELSAPRWRRGGIYVIAEAGSNWRAGSSKRDREMAAALIAAAAEAGADAVKFQTYRPETVYAPGAGKSDYLSEAGIDEDIGALFQDLSMPYELVPELAEMCRAADIDFMSTPFSTVDFDAVDPHVAVHKVASYELSHSRLIDRAARSGKPVVQSTGAATPEEIAWAVARYREAGCADLALLQCTARYPAPLAALNVRAMEDLRRRFGVAVGLSDHSREPLTGPVVATALGARVIEKHFTLHNALPGPDHAFAVTAQELADMVAAIRAAEAALGEDAKAIGEEETELRAFAQRRVQTLRAVAEGEILREGETIDILRPGGNAAGVHPGRLPEIEGRRAARALEAGEGILDGDWTP